MSDFQKSKIWKDFTYDVWSCGIVQENIYEVNLARSSISDYNACIECAKESEKETAIYQEFIDVLQGLLDYIDYYGLVEEGEDSTSGLVTEARVNFILKNVYKAQGYVELNIGYYTSLLESLVEEKEENFAPIYQNFITLLNELKPTV